MVVWGLMPLRAWAKAWRLEWESEWEWESVPARRSDRAWAPAPVSAGRLALLQRLGFPYLPESRGSEGPM